MFFSYNITDILCKGCYRSLFHGYVDLPQWLFVQATGFTSQPLIGGYVDSTLWSFVQTTDFTSQPLVDGQIWGQIPLSFMWEI